MNTAVTSRREILDAAKALSATVGLASLSIRAVAGAVGISIGSVYNYFPSKGQLLIAVVEDVWKSVTGPLQEAQDEGFCQVVDELFTRVRAGTAQYPSFFSLHTACFSPEEKALGREAMASYFGRMKERLLRSLKEDTKVRPGALGPSLTQEAFVEFVFGNILAHLASGQPDCQTLLLVLAQILY